MSEVLNPFTITKGGKGKRALSNAANLVSTSALARSLDASIFYSLLVVISLAAIPYGAVQPWWKAALECVVFGLGLLWVVQGLLSGTWFVPQHRLLIPLLTLVIFAFSQTVLPLRSVTGESALRPISFSAYDTQLFMYELLALIVVAGLLLRYTTTKRRFMTIIYVVIGVGLASSIFGFARMAFQHKTGFLLPDLQPNDGTVSRGIGFAQFINHNHFAFLAEMSLGLVLGLMLHRPLRLTRLAVGLALAIPMWIAIVYSGSRGGLVSMLGQALFVALLVFIVVPFSAGRSQLLNPETRHETVRRVAPFLVTRIVLVASVLVMMVVGIVWVGGDPLALKLESVPDEFGVTTKDRYTRTYRSSIWPATWQLIKDHPVAGTGFGAYWIAITKYHRGSGEMTPQQAHNDYLELLASGGLIGMAMGLWFVGLCARDLFKRLRAPDPVLRAASFGALAGIIAVAIHSSVDFGLHITVNALVFIVLIVIAIVNPAVISKSETAKSS